MKRYFDSTRLNFLFLVPLAAMALSDEDAMKSQRNRFSAPQRLVSHARGKGPFTAATAERPHGSE